VDAEGVRGAERSRELNRFLTFVDAVVAIAITLLVLPLVDVAGKARADGSVAHLLGDHLPQLYGFLLSFAVIAQLWFGQHHVVRTLVVQDPLVTRLMLGWLLSIVVLPFPTALVAQAGDQAVTKVLYIGTMAASSACLTVMGWRIARVREIRDSDQGPDPAGSFATTVAFALALAITLLVPSTGYYPLLLLLLTDVVVAGWRRLRKGRRPGGGMGR
jgi:uncharacterized membrane protein